MNGDEPIVVDISPTEDDYHHARRAHGVWAQVRAKGGGRQGWFGQVIASLTVLVVAGAVLFPSVMHFRPWLVQPLGVLVPILLFPAFMVLIALYVWLFGRKPPTIVTEIEEHVVTDNGSSRVKRKTPALSWPVMVTFVITTAATFFYLIGSANRSRQTPTVEQGTADAIAIPTTALIMASFACLFGSVVLFAMLQRGRIQTRAMIAKFPPLLLPRRWEFAEEYLAERGPLLESVMKWEYIRKFLETPRLVLLYPNDDTYYVVPKAAFHDELEFSRFMGLLMSKVPRGIKQPHGPVGFAVLQP